MAAFAERTTERQPPTMTTELPTTCGADVPTSPCAATGWWNPTPYSTRRRVIYHYVAEDGRTLCGKWGYVGVGTIEEGNDDHADNCSVCKKKKLALNAKSAKSNISP